MKPLTPAIVLYGLAVPTETDPASISRYDPVRGLRVNENGTPLCASGSEDTNLLLVSITKTGSYGENLDTDIE